MLRSFGFSISDLFDLINSTLLLNPKSQIRHPKSLSVNCTQKNCYHLGFGYYNCIFLLF